MKYPNTYAVYDLETTGLYPEKDEAIEIGALIVRNGEPEPVRSWLIRPATALSVDTVRITGITQAEVDEKGRPSKECWREFLEFVKGFPLVGHNISRFDNLFLANAIAKYSISSDSIGLSMVSANPIIRNGFVDTAAIYKAGQLGEEQAWNETHMDFACRVLDIKAYGLRYKLTDLYAQFGGPQEGIQAHRADSDVLMTNFLYRKFTELPEPKTKQKSLFGMPVITDPKMQPGEWKMEKGQMTSNPPIL